MVMTISKGDQKNQVADEIRALRNQFEEVEMGHHEKSRSLAMKVYLFARTLQSSVSDWEAFMLMPNWVDFGRHPEPGDRKRPFGLILSRVMPGDPLKQLRSKYARACDYLANEKADEDTAATILKDVGGIEKAAEAARNRGGTRKKADTGRKAIRVLLSEADWAGLLALPDRATISCTIKKTLGKTSKAKYVGQVSQASGSGGMMVEAEDVAAGDGEILDGDTAVTPPSPPRLVIRATTS
jgi:hypothetical protein